MQWQSGGKRAHLAETGLVQQGRVAARHALPWVEELEQARRAVHVAPVGGVLQRLAEAAADNAQLALRIEQVEGAFLLCVVS